MLSRRLAASAAICFGVFSTIARGDQIVTSPGSALVLSQVDEIILEPELIGGTPAPEGMFPVTVVIRSGNSSCTAQVSGERTLASAAHCMPNGGTVTFRLAGKGYSAKCSHSPHYRNDSTSDYALCLINEPVVGVPYESLEFSTGWCSVGQRVLLSGYGCTRPGGGGGNDGVLRFGYGKIAFCPNRDNDIVIDGGAALCFGDSGGPTYRLQEGDVRTVLGQNSRGNIRSRSYLPAWYRARGKDFATNWATANSQKVCGLHADAKGCRGQTQEPEVPAECKAAHELTGKCLKPGQDPLKCNEAYVKLGECLDAVIED